MNKVGFTILLFLSSVCFAEEPPKTKEILSGTVGYVSDYLFRGQSQTQGDPALQGSVNLEAKGLYLNAWASEVDFAESGADVEVDYTIGYSLPVFSDKAVIEVGAVAYTYANDDVSFADDTKEAFIGIGAGPVKVKFFQEFGSDLDNRYYEGSFSVSDLVPLPLGINFSALASYSDNDGSDNWSDFGFRASGNITSNLYASVEYLDEFENWAGGLTVKF
tara:strand:+ start:154 stop:810 length:657 start_codon:yes stop_codon:yes gene_type:complete